MQIKNIFVLNFSSSHNGHISFLIKCNIVVLLLAVGT